MRNGLVAVMLGTLAVVACTSETTSAPTATSTTAPPTARPAASPAPTATAKPDPTPTPNPTATPSCVETMAPDLALAQLLVPLASPEEFEAVALLAEGRRLSGVVILGAASLDELSQLPEADGGALPLVVASDEEGGRVQRLGHLLGPLPAGAALPASTTEEVTSTYADYGRAMAELGFTMAVAPVLDVGGGPGIGDRALSDDPAVVIEYGAAVVTGYRRGGVVPVIKHFPGHGAASADSHLDFSTTPAIDELRARDLLPFEALVSPDVAVLVGHLLVPGLAEDLPASLSPAAINGLLRTELGFDGVVMTDALGMNAVSNRWSNAEAAVLAVAAGADLLVLDSPAEVQPVLEALRDGLAGGDLTWEQVSTAVQRVLTLKGSDVCDLVGP